MDTRRPAHMTITYSTHAHAHTFLRYDHKLYGALYWPAPHQRASKSSLAHVTVSSSITYTGVAVSNVLDKLFL